jgi:RNA polymerase sigma-70 factor (ECF subfamily)
MIPGEAENLRGQLRPLAHRLADSAEEAEELLQATLEIWWREHGNLRQPGSVVAWAKAVLRNLWRQQRRRERFREALGEAALERLALDPWREVEQRLLWEQRLESLPEPLRKALAGHYRADHSVAALARELGRPAGTIKRWLHEGRRRMRDMIEHEEPQVVYYCAEGDSPTDFAAVAEALANEGFEARRLEMATPEEAPLDAALLLLGEQVSAEVSGLELLLALQGTPATAHLPVCLLGSARPTALLAAWKAGAAAYFTSPRDPQLAPLLRQLHEEAQPDNRATAD